MKKVTIVVPIYQDWISLCSCIESLERTVAEGHTILLINDIGPDWMDIESKILNKIQEDKRFKYVKNPCNLGFVKTCNRAGYELDKSGNDIMLLNSDTMVTSGFLEEMQKVLYSDELNGVVCPRSNNATFLSIPVMGRKHDYSAEESYFIYNNIKKYLPQKHDLATGVGFAFLVRREVIDKYGLFDEVFSPGYNEENDFCMRIKKHGYKIMAANKAYVFHSESKSFGKRKMELELKHSAILLRRYPEYWETTENYIKYELTAADYFADIIVAEFYEKKRILLDMSIIDKMHINDYFFRLKELCEQKRIWQEKYEFHVWIRKEIYKEIKNVIDECSTLVICTIREFPQGGYDGVVVFNDVMNISHRACLYGKTVRIRKLYEEMGILESIDTMMNQEIDILHIEKNFKSYKDYNKKNEKAERSITYLLKEAKKNLYIYCNFLFVLKMRIKRKFL